MDLYRRERSVFDTLADNVAFGLDARPGRRRPDELAAATRTER